MRNTHPGLEILRRVVPNETERRKFVRLACETNMSAAQILNHYMDGNVGRFNADDCRQIDEFIKSI